ncbi:MAG: nuclear transport factor 2 family protein [Flavobacteriales bacterium]|nr:nuclear transport factor 2 family protein [Flavobacteriales bacterium]
MRAPHYLLLAVIWGCEPPVDEPVTDEVEIAVKGVLDAQRYAWNSGDINGFMASYAKDVCFISPSGTTCGREEVKENYRRKYPDKARMGRLEFDVSEVLALDAQHAWCTGTWTLHRTDDTLTGGFTLLWGMEQGKWSILRDHTY